MIGHSRIRPLKIAITGPPGSGKTTAVLKIADYLRKKGFTVGGMVTKEIRASKHREGFKIIDIMTGEEKIFAHVKYYREKYPNYVVGKYGVNIEALDDLGIRAIENAMRSADIIIIDEIGKMELMSEKFIEVVRRCINNDTKPVIMTVHMKLRDPFLREIRARPEFRLYNLSPINRNVIPPLVLKELMEE